MPISILATAMKGKVALETSARVTLASTSLAFGPAIARPVSFCPSASMRTEPSSGRCASNQRMWYCSAMPEPAMNHSPSPTLASVKSPISLPSSLSIGASVMRPGLGSLQASMRSSQAAAPSPVISYLAKLEISDRPTPPRTAATSLATWLKSVERRHENAGDPEARQAAHRPDQRIAVGRKGEGAVDDLLDAGLLEGGKMAEADFQRRRDAIDVRLEQLMAEVPRSLEFGPGFVGLFVGAHQHAAALLAQIELAVEIDCVDDLGAGLLVPVGYL